MKQIFEINLAQHLDGKQNSDIEKTSFSPPFISWNPKIDIFASSSINNGKITSFLELS